MIRREFITGLESAAAWPVVARAQSTMPVVGYLSGRPPADPVLAEFRRGLAEIGFVEGRNVMIEYRWLEGHYDLIQEMVADLVRRRVAVIVSNTTTSVLAAKAASQTIPIAFIVGSDPVQLGLVSSLSHPGSNATGAAILLTDVAAKRLQLLHELLPAAMSIAYLVNPTNPGFAEPEMKEVQQAARSLGLNLLVLKASNPSEIDAAFATLVEQQAGALLVGNGTLFSRRMEQLAALAAQHALPAIFSFRENALAGGLMSYGSSIRFFYHQVGIYTGRILKGEKPADLPVQQVTKIELVVNLKTAKALGLTIPETLLATADEVIE